MSIDKTVDHNTSKVATIAKYLKVSSLWLSTPLFIAFCVCDYYYVPNEYLSFWKIRSFGLPIFLLTGIFAQRIKSLHWIQILGVFYTFTNSFIITILIFLSNDISYSYYAGLNLVTMALLTFISWSKVFLILNILAIYLPYYVGAFLFFSKNSKNLIILHSFFIFGTIIVSLTLRTLNDKLRQELNEKNESLELALTSLQSAQADLIQSEKLASLGTLSAGIAHEINNAINVINGAVPTIEKLMPLINDPKKQQLGVTLLGSMKNGIDVVVKTVTSLRNYTGSNQGQFTEFKVNDVVNSVINITRSKIGNKISLQIAVDKDLRMKGNTVGFHQIFMNLITNAVDAMPNGGTLIISAHAIDQSSCEIIVSDTGQGIPENIRAHIFDPFFTTKDVGKGTGLGLHIIRGEIEKHQGKIQVLSEVGKGTSFIITVPMNPDKTER